MGINSSSESNSSTTLKTSELNEFHNMTLFSNEILIRLHEYYKRFSAIQTDDGVIDYEEFCMIINKKDKNLTKRLFNAIDINSDGSLNYREFIKFISVFINGTLDEQITLSYKIFMNSDNKLIEYNNMKNLLCDVINAEESLKGFFTEENIEEIVKETFKEANGNVETPMNLEKYKVMVKKNPHILTWLKVDLSVILKSKSVIKHKKIGCFN